MLAFLVGTLPFLQLSLALCPGDLGQCCRGGTEEVGFSDDLEIREKLNSKWLDYGGVGQYFKPNPIHKVKKIKIDWRER